MQNLQGAAGGSGIAGLAQAMANQGQLATQRAAASIGQQEAQNQLLAARGAGQVQRMERSGEFQAEQIRLSGASQARGLEWQKQQGLMGMAAGRLGAAQQARAQATQSIIGGIGNVLGAGVKGIADGVFRKKESSSIDTASQEITPQLQRSDIQGLSLQAPSVNQYPLGQSSSFGFAEQEGLFTDPITGEIIR